MTEDIMNESRQSRGLRIDLINLWNGRKAPQGPDMHKYVRDVQFPKTIAKCRTLEDIDIIREECIAGIKDMEANTKRYKEYLAGKEDKHRNDVFFERVKNTGVTPQDLDTHIRWMKNDAKKLLDQREKEIREAHDTLKKAVENFDTKVLPVISESVLDEAVGKREIFYRLGESELFAFANERPISQGLRLADIIPRMTVEGQGFNQVTLQMFDKATMYELFESTRYKMSNKAALRKMIESGKVAMVYSDSYRIPTSLPYVMKLGSNPMNTKVFVNISDFVDLNEYGQYYVSQNRNYNGLMAVLLAAALSYRIVTSNSALPAQFGDGIILMYASMFEKVINTLVHMDPITREKVRYLCTEFAMVQMYGTTDGLLKFNRLRESYFPKLSKMIMESLDNGFPEDSFDKLSTFIAALAQQYPSMRGLTLYLIYDKWIRMYGPATALSLDYLGYHIYTICMTLMESPLITRTVLEPLLEKSRGTDIYKSIQVMLG